jgi:hypothetical protein
MISSYLLCGPTFRLRRRSSGHRTAMPRRVTASLFAGVPSSDLLQLGDELGDIRRTELAVFRDAYTTIIAALDDIARHSAWIKNALPEQR